MKNDVKISTDRYEILSSGCIIIPSLESLMFEFDGLRFKISFLAADSSAPKFVSNVDRDDKGDFLSIIMYGFENSFLFSSNKEIHVVYFENKPLYLKFSVISINKNGTDNSEDKIFYYTWFIQK